MLTKKQVTEIREHLEKAQNPVFFFDNDNDGLCSFLLLRRFLGRGKGVAVKSFPDMNAEYARKVSELNADYIFILDKPIVSEEFFEEVKQFNVPVVWIDHHDVQVKIPKFVNYYNPTLKKTNKNEPVTYLCQHIANRKEDLWIAVIGCISDRFFPDFYKDFMKLYPDLSVNGKDAFDIFYKSQIGTVAKMFNSALKDTTSNVVKMIKFLIEAKNPYDVIEENSKNRGMHLRFKQVYKKYEKLIDKAKALATRDPACSVSSPTPRNRSDEDKILFFQYGGELSISADLSNELTYLFPEKIIVVIKIAGVKANISMRGEKIKKIFLDSIKDLEDARGGGHENAIGGQIRIEDIEKFRENLENNI